MCRSDRKNIYFKDMSLYQLQNSKNDDEIN